MRARVKVIDFVKTNFLKGQEFELSDTSSFLDEGIIDSMGMIILVGFLEKTFNIKVQDEELMPENLDSVQAILSYLKSKGIPE